MKKQKSRLLKHVRNTLLASALALGTYALPLKAQSIKFGYNALETALVTQKNPEGKFPVRDRSLTDLSFNYKDVNLEIQGLNEMNDWNYENYFGLNRVIIGDKKSDFKFLANLRTNQSGIFDSKFGVRYSGLMNRLKGYGYADLSANKKAIEFDFLYGKPLGEGFSLGLYQDTIFPFNKKAKNYTELQLNKFLTDRISLFARLEITNLKRNGLRYLFGMSFNLNGK